MSGVIRDAVHSEQPEVTQLRQLQRRFLAPAPEGTLSLTEGRLTVDDFEERVGRAYAARTRTALDGWS
jgi:Domain of unknown function (DUF1707)